MDAEPGVRRVYYDSFFPMEVALDGPLAEQGLEIFSAVRDGPYDVVVSQVVVGETHTVIMGRYPDMSDRVEVFVRLQYAIRETGVDMGARGGLAPIVPEDVIYVAAGLLAEVPELEGTDLMVLAIALADPNSVLLITKDRILLDNENISRYERKLRREGRRRTCLRITNKM